MVALPPDRNDRIAIWIHEILPICVRNSPAFLYCRALSKLRGWQSHCNSNSKAPAFIDADVAVIDHGRHFNQAKRPT